MKLSDAVWIAPLLEAVARGETLEFNVGTKTEPRWSPMGEDVGFTGHRENYRIKPKVHEYRLYSTLGDPWSLHLCQRNSGNATLDRHLDTTLGRAAYGSIRWVGDWTPVPQG